MITWFLFLAYANIAPSSSVAAPYPPYQMGSVGMYPARPISQVPAPNNFDFYPQYPNPTPLTPSSYSPYPTPSATTPYPIQPTNVPYPITTTSIHTSTVSSPVSKCSLDVSGLNSES